MTQVGDESVGYQSELLDIVTAYKSLKLQMNKNFKGLDKGREHCQGKGYLKPTIVSRQAERLTLGLPPMVLDTESQLPPIRGQTAPTINGNRRGISRGFIGKTKGLDG